MALNLSHLFSSYDSHMDYSRDNKKNKFANTMAFMEEYLNNVLNDVLPFADEEKNKLTYEVQKWSCFYSNTFNIVFIQYFICIGLHKMSIISSLFFMLHVVSFLRW